MAGNHFTLCIHFKAEPIISDSRHGGKDQVFNNRIKRYPWQETEDMFGHFVKAPAWPQIRGQGVHATEDWAPQVDIAESDKEFMIKVEIPEVKKEDIRIAVNNGFLTIRGHRKQEEEEKGKKFHRVERYFGSFSRSFMLPDNIDENKIEASFKDGMLNLQVPKTDEAKQKTIEIKVK
jgi:HSP20 family protein